MAVAVVITLAVIKVIVGEMSEKAFQHTTGLVNVRFADGQVFAGARSQLHCGIMCSQSTWCRTIGWNEDSKACQGFARTFSQEVAPVSVSQVYMMEELLDGYTHVYGMHIKFFADKPAVTWQQAEDFCISEGGRLVVADTMDKYDYIETQLNTNPVLSAIPRWYIGGKKISGIWTWTTGETLEPALNVLALEPLYAFCLGFYFGGLNDYDCNWVAKIICEK